MRCEGYRRYGGVFSFGPVLWEQCPYEAVVILTVVQDGEEQDIPGCMKCWQECLEKGIQIIKVTPIPKEVEPAKE